MLRRAERSAAAIASLDLDPDDAWIALGSVHEWTLGHALHVVTLRQDRVGTAGSRVAVGASRERRPAYRVGPRGSS